MEKAKIRELIDTAIAQLSYSSATLRMQLILLQTVRKERRFLKLSVKE